jgi:hypothetical protein
MSGNLNSGRKTKAEEKEAAIQAITEEALLRLARSKVKKHLDKVLNFQQTKEMALPIVVKGMSQKLSGDKDNPIIIQIDGVIANKNGVNIITENNSG